MTQPSANREPTMEEILASIRRIIENTEVSEDEPIRMAANDPMPEQTVYGSDFAADDEAAMPMDDAEAVEAAGNSGEAEMERPVAPAISLADVAARIRASGSAAMSRSSMAGLSRPVAAMQGNAAVRFEEAVDVFDRADAGLAVAADRSFVPSVERVPVLRPRADEDAFVDDPFHDVPEADMTDVESAIMETELASAIHGADASERSDETAKVEAAWHEELAEDVGADAAGMHLMSAKAGAKVTAAFDDLNEAFSAEPRRSFDEIAEEMLRPMLQQWLDDNLPTLVERLVREEIERVARGGRR